MNATSVTTASFTVAGNSNRVMVAGAVGWDSEAKDISTVSWNNSTTGWAAVAGTTIGTAAGDNFAAVWRLIAPAAVTEDVTVTFTVTMSEMGVNALSAFDADQTTPTSGGVTGTGASSGPSVTVTGVAAGDLVFDAAYVNTGAQVTPGADQTEREDTEIVAGARVLASSQPGTAGGVMSWGSVDFWAQGACAVKAAAAGPGDLPPLLRRPQFVQREE